MIQAHSLFKTAIANPSPFEVKKPMPGKGLKGKNCNVTHCQAPESAHYYNRVTQAWYCEECATRIENSAQRDGMTFFNDLKRKSIKRVR